MWLVSYTYYTTWGFILSWYKYDRCRKLAILYTYIRIRKRIKYIKVILNWLKKWYYINYRKRLIITKINLGCKQVAVIWEGESMKVINPMRYKNGDIEAV